MFDVASLDGRLCQLFVYARGYLPRDVLYHAWRAMEEDEAAGRVFHAYQVESGEPFGLRGDLAYFCDYFAPQHGRQLLICQAKVDESIAGFIWFDDIIPQYRGMANLFFRRKFFGSVAFEAGKMALTFAFEALNLKALWALTPWREANAYAKRLGFQSITTLPQFTLIDQKPTDMQLLRLTVEDYLNGRR